MRHTSVLVLGFVLLALVASACGSSGPHAGIDTTVEAELNEKLPHINATVQAKLNEIQTGIDQLVEENELASKPFAEMAERFAGVSDRLTQING